MSNPKEIIVTTKDDPGCPKNVDFPDLHPMIGEITSMMFLWDENSYYVNVENNMFIVNGGRRLRVERLGKCRALCRKRNQAELSLTGEEKSRKVFWLIGLQDIDTESVFLVKISEDGREYSWEETL